MLQIQSTFVFAPTIPFSDASEHSSVTAATGFVITNSSITVSVDLAVGADTVVPVIRYLSDKSISLDNISFKKTDKTSRLIALTLGHSTINDSMWPGSLRCIVERDIAFLCGTIKRGIHHDTTFQPGEV